VGRLENIIARNRRGGRPSEKTLVGAAIGVFILIILGMMVFTDLGKPPAPPQGPPHVDGVMLGAPHR
jgi:hypothetical protein